MSRQIRILEIDPNQRLSLEAARDRHPKPYVRERAAALLLVAQGLSAHQVARRGLLKARKPDTLYSWLNAYQQKGLAGLFQLPRARARGFSPSRSRGFGGGVAPESATPARARFGPKPLDFGLPAKGAATTA